MTLERLRWLRFAFFSMMAALLLPNISSYFAALAGAVPRIAPFNPLLAGLGYAFTAYFSVRSRSIVLALVAISLVLCAIGSSMVMHWDLQYTPLGRARDVLQLVLWLALCVKLIEVPAARWWVAAALVLVFAGNGVVAMMTTNELKVLLNLIVSAAASLVGLALLAWAFRRARQSLQAAATTSRSTSSAS